jgi:hypothetical protein
VGAAGPAIAFDLIAWDDENDPRGHVQHIGANGLTIEEVEQVLHDPANRPTHSRSTGRPAVFGATATGEDIFVVSEVLETEPVIVIQPITAYEPMPERGECPCIPGPTVPWKLCPRKRGPLRKPPSRGLKLGGRHPRAKQKRRR